LKHIYSGKIHIGTLIELKPEFLTLKHNNNVTNLKLSNVEVLTRDELVDWKIKNYAHKEYDISGIFPLGCDPSVIADTISSVDGVVNAEILDIYQGNQIPTGNISITFRFSFIEDQSVLKVDKLLKGFGSKIR
jgi:prephenate dehydrogenase